MASYAHLPLVALVRLPFLTLTRLPLPPVTALPLKRDHQRRETAEPLDNVLELAAPALLGVGVQRLLKRLRCGQHQNLILIHPLSLPTVS